MLRSNQFYQCYNCQPVPTKPGPTTLDPSTIAYGYTISTPGVYKLNGNARIGYSIIITASNVELDLQGFTLSADPLDVGVIINGSNNVTVRNGTITGFNLTGIVIKNSNEVKLSHLSVLDNGSLTFDPSKGVSAGGIAHNTTNLVLYKSRFNNNYGIGFGAGLVSNVLIDLCTFDSNKGTNTNIGDFSHVCYGLLIYVGAPPTFTGPISKVTMLNSTANNNSAPITVMGIHIANFANPPSVSAVVLDNVNANGNSTSPNSSQVGTMGVTKGIFISANNVVIRNCTCLDLNTSVSPYVDNQISGIGVTGYDVTVDNCQVMGLSGSAQRMSGFDMETFGNNANFRNCKASNIKNSASNTDSFSFGFGLEIPIIVNGTLTNVGTNAQGKGLVIDGCIAQAVTGGQLAAGFAIGSEKGFLVKQSVSSFNTNGFIVHDYLPFPTSGGIFESNYAYDNSNVGFLDHTTTNDVYIGNRARSNGTNYQGLPAGNPIVTWDPSTTAPTANSLSNLSIS